MLNRILEKQFVNLKSNLALKSNKSHNFLGGVSLQIKSNKINLRGMETIQPSTQITMVPSRDQYSAQYY